MISTIQKQAVDDISVAVLTPIVSADGEKVRQLRLYDVSGRLQYMLQISGGTTGSVTLTPPANILNPSAPPPSNVRVT
jgi:hypothetical protein